MAVSREDVRSALAVSDPQALRAILIAAGKKDPGDRPAGELADKVVAALWWSAQTPLGYAAGRATLEDIVQLAAKRLEVRHKVLASGDGWDQLSDLTVALLSQLPDAPGVALSDMDNTARDRLKPHWRRAAALGGSAGGSFGARVASGALLGFLKGPIGRWLPLIPPIAPWVRSVGAGAATVHAVTGPLGIALTLLSVNQALGPAYKTLLPLLLGIGALGPRPVEDASEVA